jgi:hypothetical protein
LTEPADPGATRPALGGVLVPGRGGRLHRAGQPPQGPASTGRARQAGASTTAPGSERTGRTRATGR